MQNGSNQECRDDNGESEIYKVDQLRAMQWSLAAWDEISAFSIANCFLHTGLFGSSVNFLDEAVRDLMCPDEMVNIVAENDMASFVMSDAEILALAQGNPDEDPEETENNVVECSALYSKAQKMESIKIVLSLLNVAESGDPAVYNRLRDIQRSLRFGKSEAIYNWRLFYIGMNGNFIVRIQ